MRLATIRPEGTRTARVTPDGFVDHGCPDAGDRLVTDIAGSGRLDSPVAVT